MPRRSIASRCYFRARTLHVTLREENVRLVVEIRHAVACQPPQEELCHRVEFAQPLSGEFNPSSRIHTTSPTNFRRRQKGRAKAQGVSDSSVRARFAVVCLIPRGISNMATCRFRLYQSLRPRVSTPRTRIPVSPRSTLAASISSLLVSFRHFIFLLSPFSHFLFRPHRADNFVIEFLNHDGDYQRWKVRICIVSVKFERTRIRESASEMSLRGRSRRTRELLPNFYAIW